MTVASCTRQSKRCAPTQKEAKFVNNGHFERFTVRTRIWMKPMVNFELQSAQIGPDWPVLGWLAPFPFSRATRFSHKKNREQSFILNMQMIIYIYPQIGRVSSLRVYRFHMTTFFQSTVYYIHRTNGHPPFCIPFTNWRRTQRLKQIWAEKLFYLQSVLNASL